MEFIESLSLKNGYINSYLEEYKAIKTEDFLKETLKEYNICLLYTSPSPRDRQKSRMPSSA